ncbi:MAG: transcriptional regulator, GntR family [Naasia sp.]|jgi:GntR family transcriptional regulator|uniref:GntR family transcriptional regulator n=1 Tax=Naasia sp. TaxID=2546198 RepID=UPI00261EC50F|nr:GntR family transcriptional regulator [Naasia sp.]MCU1569954.1 transcriptional regulator, GntR family [Naasia sp.]
MSSSTSQSKFLRSLSARPLVRSGAVSLHWQCSEALKRTIEELHYPPAVPLPPEKEMALALGISRPTLRQAMARLASDGVIHTQRGIGAFALGGGLVRAVGLNSLYRDLIRDGRTPTTLVVSMGESLADDRTAQALRIPPGSTLQELERVRLADGVPIVLIRTKLALPDGIRLTREGLLSDGLYNQLHRVAGIELVGGNQTMTARKVTPVEADLLELPRDSAVMVAQRYAFDARGRGVESSNIVYSEGTELFTSDLRGTSVRPTD